MRLGGGSIFWLGFLEAKGIKFRGGVALAVVVLLEVIFALKRPVVSEVVASEANVVLERAQSVIRQMRLKVMTFLVLSSPLE